MNNRMPTTAGTVGILNVGAGDTKLSFDKSNPAERIRAARIVRDMLRRGYSLLIEIETNGVKGFRRAIDFDEDVCEYVIADFDPTVQTQEAQPNGYQHEQRESSGAPTAGTPTAPTKRQYRKRVPAESTRGVAVAPIAGG